MSDVAADKPVKWTGLFVSGTDTGVGKTIITAGLAAVLRADGLEIGVYKPVQSGGETEEMRDSYLLRAISGVSDAPEEIAPFSFSTPLAPLLAAEAEGVALSLPRVAAAGEPLKQKYKALLVEGAGGLAVPLTKTELIVDFAAYLGMPVLLVARAGLGTINHTILSVAYARQHGLRVAGVILNGYRPNDSDKSMESNAALIEEYAGAQVLGQIPWMEGEISQTSVTEAIRAYADTEKIRELFSISTR
ncbi:dethiobiotin synthase [Brevibacillus borstelensis]|uniref:dethiobiotin synthase n=1 Tax=Brevibacillus borstelensis TaxID=45462 RepID=UPI00046A65C8|nr:dethiobiotin synthase [Brevibacillus borstelensis]KKX54775.1 dethiobiotin synthase [Brevibacillus borstelensis cifa_chp40]MED1742770.1 dethiobiotin synthase [Brevibacillus borstelensis]MED1854770.1 dethiobiotin synthase [Brevibacillus borstelensis]